MDLYDYTETKLREKRNELAILILLSCKVIREVFATIFT
jgi:hypothetical protein